ncbi:hypothetical protein MRX96_046780 [Rhipicephalus microplus]
MTVGVSAAVGAISDKPQLEVKAQEPGHFSEQIHAESLEAIITHHLLRWTFFHNGAQDFLLEHLLRLGHGETGGGTPCSDLSNEKKRTG